METPNNHLPRNQFSQCIVEVLRRSHFGCDVITYVIIRLMVVLIDKTSVHVRLFHVESARRRSTWRVGIRVTFVQIRNKYLNITIYLRKQTKKSKYLI